MKKTALIILSVCLVLALAACVNNDTNNANSDTASDVSQSSQNNENQTEPNKTLVVYYSATGSTKAVAEAIADTAKADLFEITPSEPYTSEDLDWTNDSSRVNAEHNDEKKRDIKLVQTTPDNWEQYDTVFVGYPIWWGIAAWPVNNFIKVNDFADKTVIPFCTSSSSEIGQSGELLAEMTDGGKWLDGARFASGVSSAEVADWVKSLNL